MKKILLLFILTTGCLFLYSQDSNTISYEEFLTAVEEKLPGLEKNRNSLESTENILFKAKALHDVTLKASASGFSTKYYWDSEENRGNDYTAGFSISGDVSTKLPTGTTISAGGGYKQTQTKTVDMQTTYTETPPYQVPYSSDSSYTTYVPSLTLSITQPLLYNFFGLIDRYNKSDAKQQVDIGKLNKEEQDKMVMSYYKTVYFVLIQYEKIKINLRRSIINSRRLEEQTLAKMRSGLAENDDLQRVRSTVFRYQENYEIIDEEYKKLLNELSFFIDVENVSFDPAEFDKKFNTLAQEVLEEKSYEETRAAKITALQRDQMEKAKKIQQNKTLPQLDLFGTLDINFNYPENETETFDGAAYGRSYTKPTYKTVAFTGGLNFTYAIGNHLNQGALKDAELSIRNLDLQFTENERTFNENMKNIVTSVEVLKKRIALKESIIKSLQSQYQTELAKYNQARLELRNLLDTDSAVFSEQTELLKLKTQLILFNNQYNNLVL